MNIIDSVRETAVQCYGMSLHVHEQSIQHLLDQSTAKLRKEIDAMKRGEFICSRCGLRHNNEDTPEKDF